MTRSIRLDGDPGSVRRREWSPGRDDLEALADQLFYEVQMTFFLADQLAAPTGTRVDLSLRNAQIEAFSFHLQQLVEFFWGERRRSATERDAFAADFFPGGEWARLRPERPRILDSAIGLGESRLTYDDVWTEPVTHVWEAVSQAYALAPVVHRFVETVNRSHFDPGYLLGMKNCASLAA